MPKKIRVYELAKELGMTNKETVDLSVSLGIGIKSHSSSIEDAQADRVRRKADADGLRRAVQPEEPAKPTKATAKTTKAPAKPAAPAVAPAPQPVSPAEDHTPRRLVRSGGAPTTTATPSAPEPQVRPQGEPAAEAPAASAPAVPQSAAAAPSAPSAPSRPPTGDPARRPTPSASSDRRVGQAHPTAARVSTPAGEPVRQAHPAAARRSSPCRSLGWSTEWARWPSSRWRPPSRRRLEWWLRRSSRGQLLRRCRSFQRTSRRPSLRSARWARRAARSWAASTAAALTASSSEHGGARADPDDDLRALHGTGP